MRRGRATPGAPPLAVRFLDLDHFTEFEATGDGDILEVSETIRTVWECAVCKKAETWREGWRTYGSLDLEDHGIATPLCSSECQEVYSATVLHRFPPTIGEDGRAVKRIRP